MGRSKFVCPKEGIRSVDVISIAASINRYTIPFKKKPHETCVLFMVLIRIVISGVMLDEAIIVDTNLEIDGGSRACWIESHLDIDVIKPVLRHSNVAVAICHSSPEKRLIDAIS